MNQSTLGKPEEKPIFSIILSILGVLIIVYNFLGFFTTLQIAVGGNQTAGSGWGELALFIYSVISLIGYLLLIVVFGLISRRFLPPRIIIYTVVLAGLLNIGVPFTPFSVDRIVYSFKSTIIRQECVSFNNQCRYTNPQYGLMIDYPKGWNVFVDTRTFNLKIAPISDSYELTHGYSGTLIHIVENQENSYLLHNRVITLKIPGRTFQVGLDWTTDAEWKIMANIVNSIAENAVKQI